MSDDTKVYLLEMSFAEVELAILPTGNNEGTGLLLKVDAVVTSQATSTNSKPP